MQLILKWFILKLNHFFCNLDNYAGPDMDDVRESVRHGVTKVAGRLSSMANDMMSSFQDKYGG